MYMQSAYETGDQRKLLSLGAALRGPVHEALGLALPGQLRISHRLHADAQELAKKSFDREWAVKVRLEIEVRYHWVPNEHRGTELQHDVLLIKTRCPKSRSPPHHQLYSRPPYMSYANELYILVVLPNGLID